MKFDWLTGTKHTVFCLHFAFFHINYLHPSLELPQPIQTAANAEPSCLQKAITAWSGLSFPPANIYAMTTDRKLFFLKVHETKWPFSQWSGRIPLDDMSAFPFNQAHFSYREKGMIIIQTLCSVIRFSAESLMHLTYPSSTLPINLHNSNGRSSQDAASCVSFWSDINTLKAFSGLSLSAPNIQPFLLVLEAKYYTLILGTLQISVTASVVCKYQAPDADPYTTFKFWLHGLISAVISIETEGDENQKI